MKLFVALLLASFVAALTTVSPLTTAAVGDEDWSSSAVRMEVESRPPPDCRSNSEQGRMSCGKPLYRRATLHQC